MKKPKYSWLGMNIMIVIFMGWGFITTFITKEHHPFWFVLTILIFIFFNIERWAWYKLSD